MKTLYIIGGTMGAGKTTVCQLLKRRLPKAVFLDGDWCWDADPFTVTPETQEVVQDNIAHCLQNFLNCSAYENILFCWVLHQQSILDELLSRLDTEGVRVLPVSLRIGEDELRRRLRKDIAAGLRTADILERSVARLPFYEELNTIGIDVSALTPEETADAIAML